MERGTFQASLGDDMETDIKMVTNKKVVKHPFHKTGTSEFLAECARMAAKDKWKSVVMIALDSNGELVAGYKIRKSRVASMDVIVKGMLRDTEAWYEGGE